MEVRLAGAVERFDRRIDDRRVQIRAGLVAGTGGVNCPVRIAQRAHDRRPGVEIDDNGGCVLRRGGLRIRIVADERRHLVAGLLQFPPYVRSDEAGCAGECDLHLALQGRSSSDCLNLARTSKAVKSRRLSCLARLAGQPGLVPRKAPARDGTSSRSIFFSDLLLRSVPTGARASQFNIPAAKRVRRISSWSLTSGTFAFSTRRTSARISSNLASSRSHPCGGSSPARATMRITASSRPPAANAVTIG